MLYDLSYVQLKFNLSLDICRIKFRCKLTLMIKIHSCR